VADSCEHSNEPLHSIKGREFLAQLSDCQLFKNDCVPRSWLVRYFGMDMMKLIGCFQILLNLPKTE
jgi:hypothetical protein